MAKEDIETFLAEVPYPPWAKFGKMHVNQVFTKPFDMTEIELLTNKNLFLRPPHKSNFTMLLL